MGTFQEWADKHKHLMLSPSAKSYEEPMLTDGNHYSSDDSCFDIKQEVTLKLL